MVIDNVKYLFKVALNMLGIQSSLALRVGGALKEDGWFVSYRRMASIDIQGDPIPWFTYPAIAFIECRLKSNMNVFEYGSGASTLWWAKRVATVVSCEHDLLWYRKISAQLPGNATVKHVELDGKGRYASTIQNYGKEFDLIVIDGPERVACAVNSLSALKDSGVIIWDDSQRDSDECAEGFRFLEAHAFKRIEFVGHKPIIPNKSETAIFYRPDNIFGI